MFKQLFRTFTSLFTTAGAKTAVLAMITLMAFIPVAELLVIRMFSHLVIEGEKTFQDNPGEIYKQAAIFFVAFILTRALHHWGRFARVLAIKRAFRQSGDESGASRAAWEWALAFELSIVFVALIQATSLVTLFIVLDGIVGVVNGCIVLVVIYVITRLYQNNLRNQMGYVKGNTPTSTEVGDRVGKRILDAEKGAAVSSTAMAFALASVLYFTLRGGIAGADAVVMLLGMRLLYGQLGQLSSGAMRFGRATARRDGGGEPDPTDEDEMEEEAPQGFSEGKRSDLVNKTLKLGQRGNLTGVQEVTAVLRNDGEPTEIEQRAIHAAEAFSHYARGVGPNPTGLLWQIRPFPGVATDWMNPLLLEHVTGAPISYATPPADFPHLVMNGRLARHLNANSITVGLGALPDDVLAPDPTYVSVRGPRTASLLTGEPVTRYGEPLALAARALPVRRRPTNGRLALIRHYEHTKFDVELGSKMDEVGSFGSRPDAIRAFVEDLVSYDGVVTTSLAVMAVCQSFGVPVAPISFSEPSPVQAFAYEDHALGLGLPVVLPTEVQPDLSRTNFDDLLTTVTLDQAVLDDIQDAIHDAVAIYTERYTDLTDAYSEINPEVG